AQAMLELPVGVNTLIARHPLLGEKPVEVKVEAGKSASASFLFEYGSAEIISRPEGADIMVAETRKKQRKLGVTPHRINVMKPGQVSYELQKAGYRTKTVEGTVVARSGSPLKLEAILEPMVGSLLVASVPAGAQVAVGNLRKTAGDAFKDLPVGSHLVTLNLKDYEPWQTNVTIQDNKQTPLTVQLTRSTGGLQIESQPPGVSYELTSATDANLKMKGTTPQIRTGLPVGTYRVEFAKGNWKLPPSTLLVERQKTNSIKPALPFGYLSVATEPAITTQLEINGTDLGPLQTGSLEVPMGTVSVRLKALGYKPYATNFTLGAQQNLRLTAKLDPAYGPQPGQRWTNSLGLIFVPLGRHHICITETRRMDFLAYEKAVGSRGGDTWKSTSFEQTPADPVVNVNYEDAKAFAEWLTRAEQRMVNRYRLEEQTYRLPTDEEWSQAITPPDGLFIWGSDWPPPSNAGNFGELLSFDGYKYTAPVASFRPNRLGIYDLAGNVWEWCAIPNLQPVQRGGSYDELKPASLNAVYRLPAPANQRREDAGFRLMLDSGKAAE
ncbi:MAG: SUMF1/EgtB/PvdO family nonheme iron enzyme, partial [Verrucomicrobiota bacterium]